MAYKEERHYKSISAYTTDKKEYTVPNGKILFLEELGGDGVGKDTVTVQIIWDPDGTPETIFSTTNSNQQNSGLQLTGDGSKKMCIKLSNQDSVSHPMGGYWIGDI